VIWAATYETLVVRRLPPAAFEPAPSVAAGLIVFRRRARPLIGPEELAAYGAFVARGFRHGLRHVASARSLAAIGATGANPRDIDGYQWPALFRAWKAGS
jgi:16S rRNA A1518/A1519 N6-dimethyltransferase RsmA/KsgA/DIM1 with predicted DNA glycosylase/AP lyase activity